ncbi:hypothetical protein C8A03DRAFT_34000 [Achaetomium macrosporum]|uniref:Uncharacterized protein n=1 Tax=Achaetomium macrosporum TaxID=79813 RepID=A0AAN7HDU8_9PEZI|nr:hypothetical protein C8A03DRAFT_34000 [Achaetomium macrosporum]
MAPRRKPKSTSTASRAGSAPASRTYESTPVPQQVTFPARRKVVRTYGRRSLPTVLGSDGERRSLRQQTLTQIDYVTSSAQHEGEESESEVLQESEVARPRDDRGLESEDGGKVGRRSKRRKTMGDVPTATPGLERKGSSFHTQTLTQFLGNSASKNGDTDGLRVDDEEELDDLPLPGNSPTHVKRLAPVKGGEAKLLAAANPHTPSSKRIKVNLDEVPPSQPSPFTPMFRHYSPIPPPDRSPLTQKSINVDAPRPTVETLSKLPRNLVIQDSYSMGSSEGLPSSSAAGETPTEKGTLSREPLSEIPVASLELGVGSTPTGETPTTRRRRMFVEIPDSEDDLESIGSTPFKTRSTQQTPLKQTPLRRMISAARDFEIQPDLGSTSRLETAGVPDVPSGTSDKENNSPAIKVWDDGDSTASEAEGPGTPTPTFGRTRSQAAKSTGKASQISPNTASQFWTASEEDLGGAVRSAETATKPPTLPPAPEEPTVSEEAPSTPTPAPREATLRHRADMSDRHVTFKSVSQNRDEDPEEPTYSDNEGAPIPTSILRKGTRQNPVLIDRSTEKERDATPEIPTSEESNGDAPGTPTPVVRRVRVELPPPSTAEEVCKETPRKPHNKSSPIFQRHTQRSQYYSQGLESQRVPLEVIRSLGPQTDRSDILISIHPDIVDEIVKGIRDHEFRTYKFPVQVSRCWIYITRPVGEVKYMATLGLAQEPGQIDSNSGLGNAEFNAGASGFKFAHKLQQVYQLNNPVPLADMADNGLGDGPPQKYRYIPPAIVGQLLANLRCALFAEEGEEEQEDNEGGVTISQELEEQLRSDIVHSTQMRLSDGRHHRAEEEDVIPASQSPVKTRSGGPRRSDNSTSAHPAAPPARSSQRIHNLNQQQRQRQQSRDPRLPQPRWNPSTARKTTSTSNLVRPSQATTASDISIPSSSAVSTPEKSSPTPASVPRPPLPESSELMLPDLPDMGDESLLPPLPPVGSSSQTAVLLPPDSLLVDEVRRAPPPVEVWDSEEEDDEGEY